MRTMAETLGRSSSAGLREETIPALLVDRAYFRRPLPSNQAPAAVASVLAMTER